jgi:hypothetical protein
VVDPGVAALFIVLAFLGGVLVGVALLWGER